MTSGTMSSKRSLSEINEQPNYNSSDEEHEEEERDRGGEGGEDEGENPTAPPINPALVSKAEAARRDDRLMKNRQKARDRRNRKKALIEDMQRNVVVLSRMNAEIRRKNQDLIRQLAQYGCAGHPGTLGTDLVGTPLTSSSALSGQQASVGGLVGQSTLGLANATGQPAQVPTKVEESQAVSAAAPTADISSLLLQLPGATQTGAATAPVPAALGGAAPVGLGGAAPTALGGLNLSQIASNPALMRLLSQQQGLSDTSQQLAAMQSAVAGAPFAAQQSAAPTIQASALGLPGMNQQAAQGDSRPVHIVVHHHHPDGSQTQESQQVSAAQQAGSITVGGQTIPAELARTLNLQNLLSGTQSLL